MSPKHPVSKRQKQHDAMLKEALARPGVAEYMQVYEWWREQDQRIDAYREATEEIRQTRTTDHANARPPQ